MRTKLTITLLILSQICIGQSIRLKWKIGANEKVIYGTTMHDIDTTLIDFDEGFFTQSFTDSSRSGLMESKSIFDKLNKAIQKLDYITTLTSKDSHIVDLILSIRELEGESQANSDSIKDNPDAMMKMMLSMNQGVMLRGAVYDTGGIHSFWVKSTQKNLISLLFELPSHDIKVGDRWKLDLNLISNDQNFICDSSFKNNEVILSEIKKVNGETIAVLKYNIVEYVKGLFFAPDFFGKGGNKESMIKISHQAIAEFSLEKGRWINYDGLMTINSIGALSVKKSTKFTMKLE